MFQRERARSLRQGTQTEVALKEPKTGPKPPSYVKLKPVADSNEAPTSSVVSALVAYSSSEENSAPSDEEPESDKTKP